MEPLTIEQQQLVAENENLVHFLIRKYFKTTPADEMYEDLYLYGVESLCVAARRYDTSYGTKFSTFACKCIYNRIMQYFRDNKSNNKTISYYQPIKDGEDSTLLDIISDENMDIERLCFNKVELEEILEYILNNFTLRQKVIAMCVFAGMRQEQISQRVGLSQSQVSRDLTKITNRLHVMRKNYRIKDKEGTSVAIENENYKITFITSDVDKFRCIFAELLKDFAAKRIEERADQNFKLPDFMISYSKERVALRLPICQESYLFLALIIEKVESFKMTYIAESEDDITADTDKDFQGHEQPEILTFDEGEEDSQITSEEVVREQVSQESQPVSKCKICREYICSLDGEFSAKSVAEHFGNEIDNPTINNIIYRMKIKGEIIPVKRGVYRVVK